MKIEFPRYEDYKQHWTKETYEKEVNEDDYFKTIDDFKKYIQQKYPEDSLKIEECNKFKEQIQNAIDTQTYIPFMNEDIPRFREEFNAILKRYPLGEIRDYWKSKVDLLVKEYKILLRKNNKFIAQNKDAVFNYLDEKRLLAIQLEKEKKKQYNKKYADKKKQMLQIVPRTLLTEEEKKEHKKEANKKYAEKIKEAKGIIDKQPRQLLTEEEKKNHRKEANKKYYEKKKLESQIESDEPTQEETS